MAGLLLGAGELYFRANPVPRMGDIPAATEGADTLMRGNPWLLWELIPGDHFEQGGHVHVNAAGFRGPERAPKERTRLLAVGDSSVYGFGLDDNEVFTARLEAAHDADFINAAVPGYSTFQSLNLLRGRALDLEPDVLLVGNLWSDNNFDSFVDRELLADYAGWVESPVAHIRHGLEGSALFRGLDWNMRVSRREGSARTVGWQPGSEAPRSGKRRVSILDYATNLSHFCSIMHQRQGGVIFLLLPNREDLSQRAPSPAWRPYRTAMLEVARACGAPLVDGPAAFQTSGSTADTLFIDQMHPSAAGHALLAEAVAATLAGLDWPKQPLRIGGPPALVEVPADPYEGRGGSAEPADARPATLRLTVSVSQAFLPATVAVHDADEPDAAEPLGSAPLTPEGLHDGETVLQVRLSRLPTRVRVVVEGRERRSATAGVEGGAARVEFR